MLAHYASYEWAIIMNTKVNYDGYGIYKNKQYLFWSISR
jgi:hypothetical protein